MEFFFCIFRKPKIVSKVGSNDPIGDAFANRAQNEQRLIRLKVDFDRFLINRKFSSSFFKHRNMKINEELQKVKTQDLLHNWKEDYRASQQQLRRKRLVKGKGILFVYSQFFFLFL